jgi:hypothetical protein
VSTGIVPGLATEVRRLARFTTEPYTSPYRLRIRPDASPARTAGNSSSSLVRSANVSAISAASTAESATNRTSSPIILTTRP